MLKEKLKSKKEKVKSKKGNRRTQLNAVPLPDKQELITFMPKRS
jgi:hypothetical protein